LLFVANNIIPNAKKETLTRYQDILEEYTSKDCIIHNYIKSSINFQRFDTLNIPDMLLENNKEVLEEIYLKISS
jgi:hypothetical protein